MWDLQDYLSASETEVELKASVTCASHFAHLLLKVWAVISVSAAGGRY